MALQDRFKLEKLKIKAYSDSERRSELYTHTVMFNPASFSIQYNNAFHRFQGINTSGRAANYSYTGPTEITLDLILDGTDVTFFRVGVFDHRPYLFGHKDVSNATSQFLQYFFEVNGETHRPNFLKIVWGEGPLKDFYCCLQAVDITYTAFNRKGDPLRATLKTTFVEDIAPGRERKLVGRSSPDLSHTRVVKSGDTLPLLCKAIYGSPEYYLRVAQANNLHNFRDLTPGQELIFPPLEK